MAAGLLGPAGAPIVLGAMGMLAFILILLALGLTSREWRAAGEGAVGAARVSWRSGREAAGYVARTTQRFKSAPVPEGEGQPAPWRPDAATAGAARSVSVPAPRPEPEPEELVRPKVAITPKKAPAPVQHSLPLAENGWEFPPLSLLKPAPARAQGGPSEEALQANARLLESVLSDYGVQGTIREIRPGPVVTLYELEPAPGIRSARVIGLADDVARSLSVTAVRIATVPGRNVIGIEVPNEKRETVFLSELLDSPEWRKDPAKLALALGKDISGAPVIADLARMPHLLIAGTTGSGKSVG
ncbi:MAG: cell division protein FtsK, partial [Acetobacteraceae bacterium]|nr:cell division protein FtsK [Acetobacteraceae bacterium]